MNFTDAIDELRSLVLIETIAQRMGVSGREVRNMRRPLNGKNTVPASEGWETQIASLAREQAAKMLRLADELSPQP